MTHPNRSLLRRRRCGVPAPLILMTACAGLLIIVFQAMTGNATVQAVAGGAASILLFLVFFLWVAIVINEAGRGSRDSKPLTQRWQAQRRARRASK